MNIYYEKIHMYCDLEHSDDQSFSEHFNPFPLSSYIKLSGKLRWQMTCNSS